MFVPDSPSLVASLHRSLDLALTGGRQEEERGPAVHPAPAPAPVPAHTESVETRPGVNLQEVVRANLHAAAQHATLGHEAPSFRECSRPSCRNASNLIPYPVALESGVTESDLEEIFQRSVSAALEEVASKPFLAGTAPEWRDEAALVS